MGGNHQGNPLNLVGNAWIHQRQTGHYPEGKCRCHFCKYGTTSLAYWDEHVASLQHKEEIQKIVFATGSKPQFKPRNAQVPSASQFLRPTPRNSRVPSAAPFRDHGKARKSHSMPERRSSLPGDYDFSLYDSKFKPFLGRDDTLANVRQQLKVFHHKNKNLKLHRLDSRRSSFGRTDGKRSQTAVDGHAVSYH